MREIKFRAWDKHDQKMIYGTMAICSGDGGWVLFTAECEGLNCSKAIHDIQQYEVMQFTGLKDKSGKEVYEGDIVQNDAIDTIGVVTWSTTYPGFIILNPKKSGAFVLHNEWEVLGNIYENPSLLPESEK